MLCRASQEEFEKVRCDKTREECNVCCIHHACAHGWSSREVWRKCGYFSRGNCFYKG